MYPFEIPYTSKVLALSFYENSPGAQRDFRKIEFF